MIANSCGMIAWATLNNHGIMESDGVDWMNELALLLCCNPCLVKHRCISLQAEGEDEIAVLFSAAMDTGIVLFESLDDLVRALHRRGIHRTLLYDIVIFLYYI
jgi:hypothetical protein